VHRTGSQGVAVVSGGGGGLVGVSFV